MNCPCGLALSVAWAVGGAVWEHSGVVYCSESCAHFLADALVGAPSVPAKEIRR